MATEIIPAGDTTFQADTPNTDYLLEAGTVLDVTGNDAAILMEDTADLSTITIEGTLSSGATGLDYGPSSDLQSLGVTVAASGVVSVQGGAPALALFADETMFENHGVIEGHYSLEVVYINTASYQGGASSGIANMGTIAGGLTAINAKADQVSFANSGTITAEYVTVSIVADVAEIHNSGLIEVNFAYDQYAAAIDVTGALTLENTGQIVAVETAIICARSGGATITNSGLIDGVVDLAGGADSFTARAGGITTDWVHAGNGNDSLRGSFADDLLDGGGGGDKLRGNGGEDILYGGDGDDTIQGNGSADMLDGGDGDDRLNGGARVDTIVGGNGSDTLFGEDGADLLTGGSGLDIMEGGAGDDIFIFQDLSDSVRNSNRDVIKDFEVGSDLLDLSALPTGTFIGTAAFSSAGSAELRLIEKPNYTIAMLDADGDGEADWSVDLRHAAGLTEADFLM